MDARHPLFGAVSRAERARVPIRSIKRHLFRWTDLHWDYVEFVLDDAGEGRMDAEGNVLFRQVKELPVEILGRTSIWIGEAVYNLRSALDYLVYAVATANNKGVPVDGTQFPIENRMEMYEARWTGTHPKTGKRVARYLHHVPQPVFFRLMQLQPCSDPPCRWTATLRALSNPDKHRYLTELTSEAHVVAGYHPLLDELPDDLEKRKHPHLVVQVRFRDTGLDVVDTLEELQREVRGLIREFEPIFRQRGA